MTEERPIRPPRWWNPWDALRVLGWVFFRPSLLCSYVRHRWGEDHTGRSEGPAPGSERGKRFA